MRGDQAKPKPELVEELLEDLQVALKEALEMNCRDAEAAMMEDYEQVTRVRKGDYSGNFQRSNSDRGLGKATMGHAGCGG